MGRTLRPLDIRHTSRSQCARLHAHGNNARRSTDCHDCHVRLCSAPSSLPASHQGDRSGLLSIFTVAMVSTHIVLIGTNQTTVEHLISRTMKERENETLDEMHSFCAFRFVFSFLSPRPRSSLCASAFLALIELHWVAFLGQSGVHDKRGTQSMGALGVRLTCGGLVPCARTGNRSLARVCGHGSVSFSPLSLTLCN
jgi:hypothetical protein